MIEYIIYHNLYKTQHSTDGKVDLNPALLSPNTSHQNFLNNLIKAYAGRSGKGFGTFNDDEDNYPLPKFLRDYFSDSDFYRLTTRMMNNLVARINTQPLATGGKVFITLYNDQNKNYLLVALLSEKTAYIAQDWEMSEDEVLDIDNLKFAGRIDLTSWQNEEERYISFLKGQGAIAGYFKDFLACNDVLFARAETTKLVELLEKFAKDKDLDLEQKFVLFKDAQEHLKEISDNNEPFELNVFANRIWPTDPQIIKEYLGCPDTGISDGFIPDQRAARALSTYSGRTKHWRLSFDRKAINNGDITVENGKIIITNPTTELLKAFE